MARAEDDGSPTHRKPEVRQEKGYDQSWTAVVGIGRKNTKPAPLRLTPRFIPDLRIFWDEAPN